MRISFLLLLLLLLRFGVGEEGGLVGVVGSVGERVLVDCLEAFGSPSKLLSTESEGETEGGVPIPMTLLNT